MSTTVASIIKFKRGFRKYNLNDFMFGPILKNNVQYRNYMIKKLNLFQVVISYL